MSHYGPPGNGAAFPRGAPPFCPPQGFPSGGPPPFRPPFAARGPPPFAFRGPPPAFQAARGAPPVRGPPLGMARPPMGLNIPPPMMAGFQAPPSPAAAVGSTALPPGWSEHRTPQGATYYYNAATGVSTYDLPSQTGEAVKWVEYKDDATGAFYYYNTMTKETVWDQPEEFRMQKAREQVAKMTSEAVDAMATAPPLQTQPPGSGPVDTQVNSSVSVDQEEEVDEEERKRQETHEVTRKKRREEQEREQSAAFEDMPRAERIAAFKQFLEDKQISPTIKWGDAQRAIGKDSSMHNDPRWKFALNTVGEKKQAFAEYCTQAKNRDTIERRRLVKKAREEFTELLAVYKASLAPPSKRRQALWEDVANGDTFFALRKDPRWSAIEGDRERQQLFATFMQDLKRSQKDRIAKQRDALRSGFLDLLKKGLEAKTLELSSSRSSSSKRLDSDSKRRVLDLLEQVELPDTGSKIGEDALQIVERHDVYDWTEAFLREHRELERARRKRGRAERKRRRSHGSPSPSRSRSRSRSEKRSHRHSRRNHSRSGSPSRSRAGEITLPASLATADTDDALREPIMLDAAEGFSPVRKPRSVLSEAEEAAKVEEIIRQARLKLQAKGPEDSQLEEGEEVEDGEVVDDI